MWRRKSVQGHLLPASASTTARQLAEAALPAAGETVATGARGEVVQHPLEQRAHAVAEAALASLFNRSDRLDWPLERSCVEEGSGQRKEDARQHGHDG